MITDIYTDASLGTGTTAGIGYVLIFAKPHNSVTVGFEHRVLAKVFKSSVYAELVAIKAALKAAANTVEGKYGARLWTDSAEAIRFIEREDHRPDLQAHFRPMLTSIRREIRAAGIDLRWVKGHGSDPFNNAADRLAVMARRNREFGLNRHHGHTMAAAIAEELQRTDMTALHQGSPENIRLHRAMDEDLCPACERTLSELMAEAR
jgi:ribonuclease HI